jgi:hypothetical protein
MNVILQGDGSPFGVLEVDSPACEGGSWNEGGLCRLVLEAVSGTIVPL